ncbi:uncharacterized protein LOC120291096 [Eucalyptus grandis]|uniref:uncharacterized protein LOC120291096 n=1 Tax=Eucalyptus grandis TaxID=71139 RepID=UPI00192EC224|nr:uncharacterized protein LOC120291096 [Eucalyptus grandis]
MADPPELFGRPVRVTERIFDYADPGSHWVYELVVTTIWVDENLPGRVPHRFRAWYRYRPDGFLDDPPRCFDIPPGIIDAALGESAVDPPDGLVEDPMPPMPVEPEELANGPV